MIDLSGLNKFYELKWFDGESIWLKQMNEGMLRKIVDFSKEEQTEDEAYLDFVVDLIKKLIKDNANGRKFTQKELNQLDAMTCSLILKDYMEEIEKRLGE